MLWLSKNDTFEESSNLIFWEIVRELTHFIQKIDIFIEDQRKLWLEDSIYEKIDVGFLEDVRNFLEKFIKWYSTLIVSLLSDLIKSL